MKTKLLNLDEIVTRSMMLRVERGEFAPGDRLPTERVLAEEYGVQRMTARAALERLVNRGWASVYPRDGYFVMPRRVRLRIREGELFLRGFLREEAAWERGIATCAIVTESMEKKTFFPCGTTVLSIFRVGRLGTVPAAEEWWAFPMRGAAWEGTRYADPWSMLDGNLKNFDSVAGESGIPADLGCPVCPAWTSLQVGVAFAEGEIVSRLALCERAPILRVRIRGYNGDGSPAYFREICLREDRFEFVSGEDREEEA